MGRCGQFCFFLYLCLFYHFRHLEHVLSLLMRFFHYVLIKMILSERFALLSRAKIFQNPLTTCNIDFIQIYERKKKKSNSLEILRQKLLLRFIITAVMSTKKPVDLMNYFFDPPSKLIRVFVFKIFSLSGSLLELAH